MEWNTKIMNQNQIHISNYLLNRLNEKDLVFEFFVVFSRFEYALKHSGFVLGSEKNIFANWDRFAASERDNFNYQDNEQLKQAAEYILGNPPRKQVFIDENPQWMDMLREDEPDLLRLTNFIRTIRNNLFHGEKLSNLLDKFSPRNKHLLQNAILVLYALVNLNMTVKQAFLGELAWEMDDGVNVYE